MRKTSREIARLFAAEKLIDPAAVAVCELFAVAGDKNLRFTAHVDLGSQGGCQPASDNGKIKVFSDVDSFVKFIAKAAESSNGDYTVRVNTGNLLASKVPADLKAWAGSQIVSLNKSKVSQAATVASIDEQLVLMAGWENGNQAQRDKKNEAIDQREAVVTDIAAIDAEITRLTPLAAG